jgi:Fe-S cluster biosynthesis and repair protein YggX
MTFGEAERQSPNFSYRPSQVGSHIFADLVKAGWESQLPDFKNTVWGYKKCP